VSETSQAELRVGVVGFGYASQTFHAPLIAATPGLRLAAVSSRDAARVHAALGETVAVWPTADALLAGAEIDLVVVATPNDTHHPLARAALLAGRHVVVDKPIALDAQQAQDLIAVARAQQRLLSVFHNRRWDGDFMTVRRLLAGGALGRARYAELRFDRFRPQVRDRWRETAVPGSGIWMDLGPHLIDQCLQLFGWPIALWADIAALRDGAGTDDFFSARLRYADGLRVTVGASMLAAHAGARFLVQGTRGGYVKHGVDAQEEVLKAGGRPNAARRQDWGHDAQAGEWMVPDEAGALLQRALPTLPGDYPAYYEQLRDAMIGRAANPVPPEQALDVMTLLDLGRRSAAERRELDTPAPVGYPANP
jgi:predicted dehydrogenase